MGLVNHINLKASAFLHNMKLYNSFSPLLKYEYKDILNKAALYTDINKNELSYAINEHTIGRDGKYSRELFKEADWEPSKTLKNIIKNDFKKIKLWGSQELIYQKIKRFVDIPISSQRKVTFIISGDPGSGKTIIAFKIFNMMSQVSIKNSFGPVQMMMPGQEVRAAFKHKFIGHYLEQRISGSNMRKDYSSVIIDEAHKATGRDYANINYKNNYKQIKFAIIFIDNDQVINKKGITKTEIKQIAIDNGHRVLEYNIEENFRAMGERSLLDWIDYIFYNRETTNGQFNYQQYKYNNNYQNYKLYSYDDPNKFSNTYMNYRSNKSNTTRIVSLWSVGYYIGPADKYGFPMPAYKIGSHEFIWNPNEEWANNINKNNKEYWGNYNNYIKKYSQDRKQFLTGDPDPRFIAYFNHIQGYEFDNIFVYIPLVFTYDVNAQKIIFHRERLAKEVRVPQTWAYKF